MSAIDAVQAGFGYALVLGWVFAIAGSALMLAVAVAIVTDGQPTGRHRGEPQQPTGCHRFDPSEV